MIVCSILLNWNWRVSLTGISVVTRVGGSVRVFVAPPGTLLSVTYDLYVQELVFTVTTKF